MPSQLEMGEVYLGLPPRRRLEANDRLLRRPRQTRWTILLGSCRCCSQLLAAPEEALGVEERELGGAALR